MKRNRFGGGGETAGVLGPSHLDATGRLRTKNLKYSGMTEKEALAEWKKTATGNTRTVAGAIRFDNSLPEGHPFKDKKRYTERYKNHPLGKYMSDRFTN